jgi:hypothetical protein
MAAARTAPVRTAAPPPPPAVGVNFGDMGMYSGGAFIPADNYCMFFTVCMHQPLDKNNQPKGPNNLGVMVDFYPLSNPVEEAKLQKFYSMGSKAAESFAPNADTGKGIVPIPGAKGGTLNDKTNWMALLKSLYDSAMPAGVFVNDISVLDGLWAHVDNVDEDPERANFQSATAEVQGAPRKPGKIAVVTEILEGGAPWEGGGGLENIAAAKPAAPAARPAARPAAPAAPAARPAAARPPIRQAAPPPPPPADEGAKDAAIQGTYEVLIKNPNGMPRLSLRNETFKAVQAAAGDEVAGAVINEYFDAGDDVLSSLLAENGFKLDGKQVKPL